MKLLTVIIGSLIIATIIVVPITLISNKLQKKHENNEFNKTNPEVFHAIKEHTPEELQKLQYEELKNINIQLHDINRKLFTQNRMLDTMNFYFGLLLFILLLPTIIKILATLTGASILSNIL